MDWSGMKVAWNELVDQILDTWPEMTAAQLMSIAGDRGAFAAYLSATYDLTIREAEEVIDEWLIRRESLTERAENDRAA